MSYRSRQRQRAAILAVAPLVLLTGLLLHPYISDSTDAAETAVKVAEGPTRWVWAHVIIALGLALTVVALSAFRSFLRAAGDQWSFLAVPFFTVGVSLLIFFVGVDGLGGWATTESAGSAEAFYDEAEAWAPLLVTAGAILSIGLLLLAVAIKQSRTLPNGLTWLVVTSLVVSVIANFIPYGWTLYVIGTAAAGSLWPVAYIMWRASGDHQHAAPAPT